MTAAGPASPGGHMDAEELGARLVGLLAKNMTRVMDLFRQWDTNSDGQISKKEFKRGMVALGFHVSSEDVSSIFQLMDPDGSGTIDFQELHRELRKAKANSGGDASPQSAVPPSPRLPTRDDGHPLSAVELESLARDWQQEGKMFEAQHALERALQLYRKQYGIDSAEVFRCSKQVADVSNSLAMQYLQQDAFAACLMLLKKAEALAGRHKPLLAITMNNLACYYRRRAQPKMALGYLQKALEIEGKCREPHKPADTHLNACAVQSQLGRHQQAMQHCRAALQLLQLELGWRGTLTGDGLLAVPNGRPPPDRMAVLAIAFHNLGVEQEHLGLTAEAVRSYEQAFGIGNSHLGAEHPITVTLAAAHAAAVRTLAALRSKARPTSAHPSTPKAMGVTRPSSAATERTRESVRRHIETVAKIRDPNWTKPLAKPHVPRDPDSFVGRGGGALSDVDASGAEALPVLRDWLDKNQDTVMRLFKKWDTDESGDVTVLEFSKAMQRLGLKATDKDVARLFAHFDTDGGGSVEFNEMNKLLRQGALQRPPDDLEAFDACAAKAEAELRKERRKNAPKGASARPRTSKKPTPPPAADPAVEPAVALDPNDPAAQIAAGLRKNMKRVMDLFREWDENEDGEISKKEFKQAMKVLKIETTPDGVDALFGRFDADGKGTIDFKELNKLVRAGTSVKLDPALQPGASGTIELSKTSPRSLASASPRTPTGA